MAPSCQGSGSGDMFFSPSLQSRYQYGLSYFVFHCGEYSSESSLIILLILHSKSLSESQKPWSLCYLKFTQEFSKCIVISKLSLFLFVIQQAFNFWLKIPGDKLSVIAEVVKMLHNSSLL